MYQAVTIEISNPFPGLRPFREDEEHLFFGRENQVDAMVDKLAKTRFLAVVGTSGSGKSSLVNCGLRPALHRGLMARAGTSWRMAQFRPGGHPIRAMARALAKDGVLFRSFDSSEGLGLDDMVEATLRMSKLGVVDVYKQAQLHEGTNLLLVVDQFEELFRYRTVGSSDQAQEATAFVNLLLEPKADAQLPIYVVLTMRSDFLGDCAEFTGLPEAINQGQYLVPRMNREERRAAVRGPAGVGGAEISPVLLTRLVNDVGDNPDQLSILQHALNRTWSRWQHEGRGEGPLDLAHYQAIGTMAGALDQHAEKAFAELIGERQKSICEKIFKALTDKGTDARGIRRPTSLGTLCGQTDASEAEVIQVIEIFRKPSRSFLMPPQPELLDQQTIIDISHESLMRVWERLKGWADEEAQSAQVYRRLSETAALHAAGKAALWRDPELQLALEWREREKPTQAWAGLQHGSFEQAMSFLAQSQAQRDHEVRDKEERQRRELEQAQAFAKAQSRAAWRLRRWATAAAVLALMAILAAGFAWKQRQVANAQKQEADSQRTIAEGKEQEAEKQKTIAEKERGTAKGLEGQAKEEARRNFSHELAGASAETNLDPGLSLLLALEAVSTTYSADKTVDQEAEEALQRALQASQTSDFSSGHTAAVRAVAYSPDKLSLATASADKTARIWDAASGLCLLTLSGHTSGVNSVAFSPDGKRIATASEDHTVKLWDARSGTELGTFVGHADNVYDVAFSSDGKHLATASQDATAKVWNTAKPGGDPVTFSGHDGAVNGVAFSPNGKLLATAGDDHTVKLWNAESGKELPPLPGQKDFKGKVNRVSFSSDGNHLASANEKDGVNVWDLAAAGSQPRQICEHFGARDVAFSPNGNRVAIAGADSTARICSVDSGEELLSLPHPASISGLSLSFDGQRLATASSDKMVRVWDASYGQELAELSDLTVKESLVALSPDGKLLAVTSTDGTLRLRDVDSGLELFTLSRDASTSRVSAAAFSPGGLYFVAIGFDKVMRTWETRSGSQIGKAFPIQGAARGLAVSDGRRVATINDTGLNIWDAVSGNPSPAQTSHTLEIRAVAFSPDGKLLATVSADRTGELLDGKSGAFKLPLKNHTNSVEAVAFSPNGKRLATASSGDKTVRFWDAKTGSELEKLRIQVEGVYTLAFSPDGSKLAAACRDGNVRVWNVESGGGQPLKLFLKIFSGLRLAFQPDGDLIVATDMMVREYPLSIRELIAGAQMRLSQSWTDNNCLRYLHSKHCPPTAGAVGRVVEGNNFLRVGDTGNAMVRYRQALDLDPSLQLDAREVARELEVEGLLATGRSLASFGDVDGAIASFSKAKNLDPSLRFDPMAEAGHVAARAFVAKGRNLARANDLKGAVESLQKAKQLDPGLSLNPDTEAGKLAARSLNMKARNMAKSDVEGAIAVFREVVNLDPSSRKSAADFLMLRGRAVAASGDVDRATAVFREVIKVDPNSTIKPEVEAKKWAAEALLSEGSTRAKSGDVSGAIAAFRSALERDPTLKLDPEAEANRPAAESRLATARQLARQDKIADTAKAYSEAISIYEKFPALDPDASIRAEAWNDLCWQATVRGHAAEVMEACERAVQLAGQQEPASWNVRDSRGLARALTGNTRGAIEDFQFFIDHTDMKDRKQQRQQWVEALRAGKQPFTPEVLKSIFDQ